jgi:subtilase family serine protease
MANQSKRNYPAFGLAVLAIAALAVTFLASSGAAQNSGSANYGITGNTPGFVAKAADLGSTDPNAVIAVTVWLKLHNEAQLDQLVGQQYQKGSPNFHKWITQDNFNATFSPTAQEVKSVQNFLTAHGLSVVAVADNNFYVMVQGAIGDIEKAFHVDIHNYNWKGQRYRSNTGDPNINDGSGAHVAAISGMDDLGFVPNNVVATDGDGNAAAARPVPANITSNGFFFESQCFRAPETHTFKSATHKATYTGNRFGADINNSQLGHLPPCGYQPSELHTAYNMNSLYAKGLNGAGQTIVIVDAWGSGTIAQDAEVFSQLYGLPHITSSNFQVVKGDGIFNNNGVPNRPTIGGWATETSLDVEWAHAMAPGAKIALVVSPNGPDSPHGQGGGPLFEAVNLAVARGLGNVVSNSWSTLEGFISPAATATMEHILKQAAAKGIDVNFSTGDSGDNVLATGGFKTVDYPASSPNATGVGGTSLFLNPDNTIRVQTGWGNNLTRIADLASLGAPPVVPPLSLGFQGGAGGGSSLMFAKPAFQSALAGSTRQVPDISMVADPFTGVEIIQTLDTASGPQVSVGVVGGTSVACPVFSGVMAVASQKAGHGLGQAAPLLYGLSSGITDVVDVTSPDNVTGTIDGTFVGAATLAAPLENTTNFVSALYNSPFSTRWFVITFGTDSSLTTGPGWDNVTGLGTPSGESFVTAIAP